MTLIIAGLHPSVGQVPPTLELPATLAEFPSIIRFPNTWWGTPANSTECYRLNILLHSRIAVPVFITSAGLGSVQFAADPTRDCNSLTGFLSKLQVTTVSPERQILVRFTSKELLEPGAAIQGKLMLLATGFKPAETTIKLERLAMSPTWHAAAWFIGILIPAVIGFIIGVGSTWLKSRWDSRVEFAKYRYSQFDYLTGFFSNHYLVYLTKSDKEFCLNVFNKLSEDKILENVPMSLQNKIFDAVRRGKRDALIRLLLRAFPEWQETIKI